MDIEEITLGNIIQIGSVITALILLYKNATKPVKTFTKRVEDLETHLDNDNKRLKILEEDIRMILKATRVLVMHSVSNNETGELKKIQEEIDEYLINK